MKEDAARKPPPGTLGFNLPPCSCSPASKVASVLEVPCTADAQAW
jgi:hypothetical protein